MRPDGDEYLEDERTSRRSLLASGWVRALLVLGALILLLFVSVPYLLRSSGPPRPPRAPMARSATPAPAAPAAAPPAAAPPASASPAAYSAGPSPPAASPGAGTAEQRHAAPGKEAAKAPTKTPTTSPRAEPPAGPAKAVAEAASGEYWVQAGVFENERNADRLAERLRRDQLSATVGRVTRGSDAAARHEIVVTGANSGAVNALLQGKGNARDIPGAVVVEPALELKDAVALSKRLAAEGLTVKIRRVADGAPAVVHMVSVGPYPTRAGAEAASKALATHGVRGFVRQGPAR